MDEGKWHGRLILVITVVLVLVVLFGLLFLDPDVDTFG